MVIHPSRRRSLAAVLYAVLLIGLVLEGAAKLAIANKDHLLGALPLIKKQLHDYQETDPDHPATWRLKAGFSTTFGTAMPADARRGHPADEVFIRINSDGFRGPEIDRSRPHPRILTIGDSCTFGTIEQSSYPRVIERELTRRGASDVEVINAGVEGYSPRDVLYQMERYRGLRPSIATVYIGWGSLYNETHALDRLPGWARLDSLGLLSRSIAHLRAAGRDPQVLAEQARAASLGATHADPAAPELRRLDGFVPTFMGDVEEIVRVLRAAGTTVVLVTLPGLYTVDSQPTERALRIGNMPVFTRNPFVLARMADRYNTQLRALARREGLQVIDLDAWSRTALVPRDAYFANAVHLDERAQELAGRYMSEALAPTLSALGVRSTTISGEVGKTTP